MKVYILSLSHVRLSLLQTYSFVLVNQFFIHAITLPLVMDGCPFLDTIQGWNKEGQTYGSVNVYRHFSYLNLTAHFIWRIMLSEIRFSHYYLCGIL